MLQEFKDLVDKASSRIAAFKNDYNQICAYLNIDISTHYSASMVTDKLKQQIEELLEPVDGVGKFTEQMQSDLRDGLVYEAIFSDTDNSAYLIILKILSSRRVDLVALDHENCWAEAIAVAKDYQAFAPEVYNLRGDLRENYPQQYDVAQAALSLKALGCEVVLADGAIEVKSGLEKIAEEIATDISNLGSIFFMYSLFQHLVAENKFFQVYQRYLIVNQITMLPHQTKPMIPYGYLLNIAVKQKPDSSNKYNPAQLHEIFGRIIQKATLLGAILNVRYYGTWEVHAQSPRMLPQFVRRLALFDSAFSFPSMDMREVIEYLTHLFNWLDTTRFSDRFGFSIADFIAVTTAIENHAIPNGPMKINVEFLKAALPTIPESIFPEILQKLAHELGSFNKDYVLLTDYDKLDFGFKPLIRLSSTDFLLCDKSWCAIGFYEVFATLARELDMFKDECNNKIGVAIETFIYNKLSERGITFSKGDYAEPITPKGEADAIIEANEDITLIEIKKKVLTRRSKTGSDVQLIIDLAGSLLDAHYQTGRTELLLRKQGHLDLVDNTNSVRVNWNQRNIERIAITQWDFGSFQDRVIINSILEILANAQFGLTSDKNLKDNESFAKFEKKRKLWSEQVKEFTIIDHDFNRFPFFNCWFLSLSQLLVIIRYCNNNEDFHEVLKSTRSISYGTYNFYLEFFFGYIYKKTE